MELKQFTKSIEEMRSKIQSEHLLVLVMVACNIVLALGLLFRDTVVTVVPWTLSGQAEVTEGDASQSYKEAWGMAISLLLGNVQPATVDFIAERIKPLLSPEIYHESVDALYSNAQILREERVTLRFEPRRVTYEKTSGRVFVSGFSYSRLGTSMNEEKRHERTFEIGLEIAQYAPVITYIDTYTGKARTADVLANEKKKKERERYREKREHGGHTEQGGER